MLVTSKDKEAPVTYAEAGVDEPLEQLTLASVLHYFRETYSFRQGIGRTARASGHFANVLDLGAGMGLVFTTDGVGTKLLIAQALSRFDTIGIDCVANNVNDILCLGAEPVAMLDYIAIDFIDRKVLEQIARGLRDGAREAGISIPGGEIAQVADMLAPGGASTSLDLVGSAVGLVALDPGREDLLPLLDGRAVVPGDVVVGIHSSGLHSNGYSLARTVLLKQAGLALDTCVNELGRSLGDELLAPAHIFVKPVLPALKARLPIHGLVNISGGGLLSLARLSADWSYRIHNLPPPLPIFNLIQRFGALPKSIMYAAFNMGVGFCVVCPRDICEMVIETAREAGYPASIIGEVIPEKGRFIYLDEHGLTGSGEVFR